MGKKAKRLRGEEVYEALASLARSGGSTSTGAVWDEVASNWPEGQVFPGQQAVYLHLVRLQKAGRVTSKRVGQEGGGQHAVWELVSGAETPLPAPIGTRDVSTPGPEEIGPEKGAGEALVEEAEKCRKCGGELEHGYGFYGGGLGSYSECLICGDFNKVLDREDEEGEEGEDGDEQ